MRRRWNTRLAGSAGAPVGLLTVGLLTLAVARPAAAQANPAPKPAPAEPAPAEPAPAEPTPTAPAPAPASDPAAAAADAVSTMLAPASGEDDGDDWGLDVSDGDKPGAAVPMVAPDMSRQPGGYTHEPHHKHGWFYHNLTAARVNPLGLTNRFRTGYRMQLSHRPENIFEDSYSSVQLDTEITPAFGYVGGRFEVQPAKLFNFWASYGFIGSFGGFSYTRSFSDASAEYDDALLKDSRDHDYAAKGQKAIVSGLFQFGIGGVAFRNNVKGHFMSLDLADDDRVFYDATLDVLVPNTGWVITNDADLLVITDFDLIIGLRHTYTEALYKADHLAGENLNTPHHRLGPAFIYQFFDDGPGTLWNKPTAVLLTQWWLDHRYRIHENPALPYLVLGFVQQGDFLISDKE